MFQLFVDLFDRLSYDFYDKLFYVSGQALVDDYAGIQSAHHDLTIQVDTISSPIPKLNEFFDEYTPNNYVFRRLTDDVVIYLGTEWSLTLNPKSPNKDKFIDRGVPNIRFLAPEIILTELAEDIYNSNTFSSNLVYMYYIINFTDLNAKPLLPNTATFDFFYNDAYLALSEEKLIEIATEAGIMPDDIKVLFTIFVQPMIKGWFYGCTRWVSATRTWHNTY